MTTPTDERLQSARTRNLALATWTSTINFWAWNLIAPLSVTYSADLELSTTQTSILVAVPVLVGSLGRIVVGVLTDRLGGRRLLAFVTLAAIIPVLLVCLAGNLDSYPLLIAFGFLLGIPGAAFAAGVTFVNAWYPPTRRGFATGVFGAGMAGTALSAFFTPRFVDWFGYTATHVVIAVALLATGLLVLARLRDSPDWQPNTAPPIPKLRAAAKLKVTWQMSFLYAVTFGGFVAFSTYLPTYLKTIYDFTQTEAGTRTAGFALAAVIARPIGGVLSDRLHPKPITMVSLAAAAVLALVVALEPSPELAAGATFVAMALALGLGAGAVFAWVARRAPTEQVGTISGIVSAAGGLGGFFPPLVMGATYDESGADYTVGLVLLCITAALSLAYVTLRMRREASARPESAP